MKKILILIALLIAFCSTDGMLNIALMIVLIAYLPFVASQLDKK